ncbi:MAG: hypothetical protein AAFU64_07915, partial [Bacteroidota bacterium]
MKIILTIFILFILTNKITAQEVTVDDSLLRAYPFLESFVQCMDGLDPIEYFETHPWTKDKKLCSLAMLILFLEIDFQDPLLNQAI